MQPLIVGLDPGTTSAYAVLDIDGDVIKVASERNAKLSDIIKDIISYGKPLLIGTDKEKVPSFVKKFAILTGANIVSPEEDLLLQDKRINIKTKNEHENDALASAFFAYEQNKKLFDRINNKLKKKDKPELKNDVVNIVFSEKISIDKALKILESK
jgi:uncharacterized protein